MTAAGDGDGHLIEVADRGFGMTDQELAWANRRLAGDIAADPAGLVAGDRLGLLVAARLAARNGFGVRLDRVDQLGHPLGERPAPTRPGAGPARSPWSWCCAPPPPRPRASSTQGGAAPCSRDAGSTC